MFWKLRSFQRGTVCLCLSNTYKVTRCQSWRSEENSTTRPESNHMRGTRLPDNGIIFKVWRTTTLQPFDLQRLTVPLCKNLNLLNIPKYILSIWRTSGICKIGLHRAYLVRVCIFFWLTVLPHQVRPYKITKYVVIFFPLQNKKQFKNQF